MAFHICDISTINEWVGISIEIKLLIDIPYNQHGINEPGEFVRHFKFF